MRLPAFGEFRLEKKKVNMANLNGWKTKGTYTVTSVYATTDKDAISSKCKNTMLMEK
jgi:hypothetical protein